VKQKGPFAGKLKVLRSDYANMPDRSIATADGKCVAYCGDLSPKENAAYAREIVRRWNSFVPNPRHVEPAKPDVKTD
jgi:hypothetical protein